MQIFAQHQGRAPAGVGEQSMQARDRFDAAADLFDQQAHVLGGQAPLLLGQARRLQAQQAGNQSEVVGDPVIGLRNHKVGGGTVSVAHVSSGKIVRLN